MAPPKMVSPIRCHPCSLHLYLRHTLFIEANLISEYFAAMVVQKRQKIEVDRVIFVLYLINYSLRLKTKLIIFQCNNNYVIFLTLIGNISGKSPIVIFGNQIQITFFITSDVIMKQNSKSFWMIIETIFRECFTETKSMLIYFGQIFKWILLPGSSVAFSK